MVIPLPSGSRPYVIAPSPLSGKMESVTCFYKRMTKARSSRSWGCVFPQHLNVGNLLLVQKQLLLIYMRKYLSIQKKITSLGFLTPQDTSC